MLAALWPLADAPSARFQSAYYQNLTHGLGPAAALAATQRSAVRGELGKEGRLAEHFGGYRMHGLA